MVNILKSQPSVKGIKVEIRSEFWGEEYAASAEKPTFEGVIDRWEKKSTKDTLYILWEGYTRNQKAPLDKMNVDAAGNSLALKFLPGADGNIPKLVEGTTQAEAEADDDDDDEEIELPEFETFNEQKWKVEKDPRPCAPTREPRLGLSRSSTATAPSSTTSRSSSTTFCRRRGCKTS